jgi:hypothetical protein
MYLRPAVAEYQEFVSLSGVRPICENPRQSSAFQWFQTVVP